MSDPAAPTPPNDPTQHPPTPPTPPVPPAQPEQPYGATPPPYGGPQQPGQPGQPYGGPAQPAAPLSQADDIQWASFAHLGGVVGPLPSLIIWLVFKDRGRFTDTQAKEALNFQLTLTIVWLALWIVTAFLSVISFGLLSFLSNLVFLVWVLGVIFSIIAFLQVKDGRGYRYPFAIRMIK